MENIEVRNLGMFPDDKTGYSPYESEVFEVVDGTPKRGLTTARLRATLGGFRKNVSVVCPEPEQRKGRLSLTRREGDDLTKAMHYLVEMFVKHAFGKNSVV